MAPPDYRAASHALFAKVTEIAANRGWLLVRGPSQCGKRFIIEATLKKHGYSVDLVTDDGDENYKTALINSARSFLTRRTRAGEKRAVLLTYASELGPTELKRLVESSRGCALFMTDTERYLPALEGLCASQFFLPARPSVAPVAVDAIENIFEFVDLLRGNRRFFNPADGVTRYLEHLSICNPLVAENLSEGDVVRHAGLLTLESYVTHTLPQGAIQATPSYSAAARPPWIDYEGRFAKMRASHPFKGRNEIIDAASYELEKAIVIAPRGPSGSVLSEKKRRALQNVADYRSLKRPRIESGGLPPIRYQQLFFWSDHILSPESVADAGFCIQNQRWTRDRSRVGVWIERV